MKLTHNAGLRAARALGLGLLALACVLAVFVALPAFAQGVSTTTVQGTVYLANGQPGSGTLMISWPAFTTSNGLAVAAGSLNATIASDGFVSVNLTPNLGALPAGLFYTAVYHMSDGTTSTEYWVVPAAASASIASVRAQVMPAAQAVQAASKAYVDQAIASLTTGSLSPIGGTLTGPLYLSGDPTQALQAADKHYVDATFANAMPLSGGAATGPLTATQLGAAYQVDQFPGADFGAKLQTCIAGLSSTYGGTCDARNFTGTQSMASNVTISTANATVLLPCATISTAKQFIVTAGTRNVALRGCALRGSSAASGNSGGTVLLYSGSSSAIQVGDPTYAADTQGFHLDNAALSTTAASNSTAHALTAYRTQEIDLQSLYLLGNSNQTGITLDGTGNYTGGTFYDIAANGFQIAVNAIGHQIANAATTDWLNASTFVRPHINCPTSGGSPIAGTIGINLVQGDGNTFTGGDVEGCATALHLGLNAQNNTIVGLRNENSTTQVVADTGSSYNSWITGGTMFTGKLADNGTHNSFLDSFHRTFNGIYGDWYASQQDATLTNHFRIGTGLGNERGLLNRYQTDYGYRWTTGLTDAVAGAQFYEVFDELNNINRLSIGQYLTSTANTVTNVALNSGGCYSSTTAPTLAFSGGGGTGAAGTANMVASQCSGGYTVGNVTMTNNGSAYTAQPTIAWSGGAQLSAPSAVAEIATAGSTNNQTVLNAAGTGAVVLNGSNNSGTGGVVIGSGGPTETTVATIGSTGNANFTGTLQVGGASTFAGSTTVRNQADAEIDSILQAGNTAEQKESYVYRDHTGASQWYLVKDQYSNWAVNSALSGINSFKAYQSTSGGDTYVNASSPSGVVRVNYEPNSGTGMKIYGGSSSTVYAAFTAANAIQFPGLAASSGHNCVEIDNSGYISNTGSPCGSGSGSGTVNAGATGQIAYYNNNGAAVSGISAVPVASGGTGATTAAGALAALGAASLSSSSAQTFTAPVTASINSQINVMAPPYNAYGDCTHNDGPAINAALRAADTIAATTGAPPTVYFPMPPQGCYLASTITWYGESLIGQAGTGGSVGGAGVTIQGMPGEDVFHVPDPNDSAYHYNSTWSIRDITISVDGSSDASGLSGSFPHRWPGRWVGDASIAASSTTVTSANAIWSCGDIGTAVEIPGAGSSGANLVTTVASLPMCATTQESTSVTNTAVLAAAASTTVTAANMYIAPVGLAVTDQVGNCGMAFDNRDGKGSDYIASGTGNLRDTMNNILIRSVNSPGAYGLYGNNHTCALYFQGIWMPYSNHFDNISFVNLFYGVVEGTRDTNPAGSASNNQTTGNDFQDWENGFWESSYPWISYNGTYGKLDGVEVTSLNGPQFQAVGSVAGESFSSWSIRIPEFETPDAPGVVGMRFVGTLLDVSQTRLAAQSSQVVDWDASQSKCHLCQFPATIEITGDQNTLEAQGSLNATTVTDYGAGNLVYGTGSNNGSFFGWPSTSRVIKTGLHWNPSGLQTNDFALDGNVASPYFNRQDLFFAPLDLSYNITGGINAVATDSASLTGYNITWPNNFSPIVFNNLFDPPRYDGGVLVSSAGVTGQLPAAGVLGYFAVKCSASETFTMNLTVATGVTGSQTSVGNTSVACNATGYTTGSITANLSSYGGYYVGFKGTYSTGQAYVSYLALRPYQADYNGYQPAHSAANSDITSLAGLITPLAVSEGGTGATTSTGSGAVVLASGPTLTGNTTTFANSAAAELDVVLKPGSTADQIGAYTFANYSGTTQWKLRKDASNYLRLTDSVNSLDREILYQNGQSILNAGAGANAIVLNGTTNSGTGGLLVQNGGSSPSTVLTVSGSGNTTAAGFVSGKSMMGTGTMTLAAGAAAGTSPTIACATSHVCDGISGTVTLTTGTSPTTGTLATLSFPNTHSNYANCVLSAASSSAQLTTVTWSESTTAVTLTANAALTASTAYQIRYWCGGN